MQRLCVANLQSASFMKARSSHVSCGALMTLIKHLFVFSTQSAVGQSMFSQTIDDTSHQSNRLTEFKVSATKCTCTLRFPQLDFTQGAGASPWWKRRLQKELCILELTDFDIKTSVWPAQAEQQYEITCRDVHGTYRAV